MKVHWTNTAEGHLDAIFKHIAQNSPGMPNAWLIALPGDLNRLPNIPSRAAEFLNTILIRFAK